MEEQELVDLFEKFNPELSSDANFMARLNSNLYAVECVKQKAAALQRKNKIALVVASVIGFVFGVIGTLCYPILMKCLSNLFAAGSVISQFVTDYGNILVWTLISAITLLISYTAYDLTLLTSTVRDER